MSQTQQDIPKLKESIEECHDIQSPKGNSVSPSREIRYHQESSLDNQLIEAIQNNGEPSQKSTAAQIHEAYNSSQ